MVPWARCRAKAEAARKGRFKRGGESQGDLGFREFRIWGTGQEQGGVQGRGGLEG